MPATLNPYYEWGPSAFDRTHNANVSITSGALRNFSARFFIGGSSAPPLTIRTGFDDNGDLIFNDRPDGVEPEFRADDRPVELEHELRLRVHARQQAGDLRRRRADLGGPGGLTAIPTGMQTQPRYRLNLSVNIQNLFNHAVYSGYSGAMNSQFFLQPTRADGVRRITFNANVSF